MKITNIRHAVAPIASAIRNAYIAFDKMTISVVAVETDQRRDGGPVIGYGFHSNGRYAQPGVLSERLVPRLAIGWTMGAVVSAAGVAASFVLDLPTGATIVATFGAALLVVGAFWRVLWRERVAALRARAQTAR